MILVDTSVWIDHLRSTDPDLSTALTDGQVLSHPWVIGEIALGQLRDRGRVISLLRLLPRAPVATADEVLHMIEHRELGGRSIGYVDANLLASATLHPETLLWTRDRRLASVAAKLGVGIAEPHHPTA